MLKVRLLELSSGLFTAHIWQLRSLLSGTFSVHKTQFPYGPWKWPGRVPGQLPTALAFVRCWLEVLKKKKKKKKGVEGFPRLSIAPLLCASVQFRGNLHHFLPCLAGTNARVSLLERDGSTDQRPSHLIPFETAVTC